MEKNQLLIWFHSDALLLKAEIKDITKGCVTKLQLQFATYFIETL